MEFLLAAIALLLMSMLGLIILVYSLATAAFPSLTRSDLVAIMYSATHKSLTLGMPLLKILFGGHPDVSVATISIPLLIYHPLQIVVGSMLVAPLQRWLVSESPTNKSNFMGSENGSVKKPGFAL